VASKLFFQWVTCTKSSVLMKKISRVTASALNSMPRRYLGYWTYSRQRPVPVCSIVIIPSAKSGFALSREMSASHFMVLTAPVSTAEFITWNCVGISGSYPFNGPLGPPCLLIEATIWLRTKSLGYSPCSQYLASTASNSVWVATSDACSARAPGLHTICSA